MAGSHEVRGSIPLCSTTKTAGQTQVWPAFLSVFVGQHRLTDILPTFRILFTREFGLNRCFGIASAGAALHIRLLSFRRFRSGESIGIATATATGEVALAMATPYIF